MANERFNHKYNHCKGINCENRFDCALHLAFKESISLGLFNINTFDKCSNKELDYVKVRIEK